MHLCPMMYCNSDHDSQDLLAYTHAYEPEYLWGSVYLLYGTLQPHHNGWAKHVKKCTML